MLPCGPMSEDSYFLSSSSFPSASLGPATLAWLNRQRERERKIHSENKPLSDEMSVGRCIKATKITWPKARHAWATLANAGIRSIRQPRTNEIVTPDRLRLRAEAKQAGLLPPHSFHVITIQRPLFMQLGKRREGGGEKNQNDRERP